MDVVVVGIRRDHAIHHGGRLGEGAVEALCDSVVVFGSQYVCIGQFILGAVDFAGLHVADGWFALSSRLKETEAILLATFVKLSKKLFNYINTSCYCQIKRVCVLF